MTDIIKTASNFFKKPPPVTVYAFIYIHIYYIPNASKLKGHMSSQFEQVQNVYRVMIDVQPITMTPVPMQYRYLDKSFPFRQHYRSRLSSSSPSVVTEHGKILG